MHIQSRPAPPLFVSPQRAPTGVVTAVRHRLFASLDEATARRIVLVSLLGLYLATPLSDVYWDGITFALHIERWLDTGRGLTKLFHPNHLLFTPLLASVTAAVRTVAPDVSALSVLQVTSALFSVAALHRVGRLTDWLTGDGRIGTSTLLMLGATSCWWRLAGDASAYPLAVLLLVIAIEASVRSSPRWLLVGLALAGAMFVHQLAALGCLAVLVAGATARGGGRRVLASFATVGGATTLCVGTYAIVAIRFYGARTLSDVVAWAASNTSGTTIRTDFGAGLWLSARAQLEAVAGLELEMLVDNPNVALLVISTVVTAMISLAWSLFRARRARPNVAVLYDATPLSLGALADRPMAMLLISWVAPYVVFLTFWEPWFVSYRVFYLPALAILAGAIVARIPQPANGWAVTTTVTVAGALLAANFVVTIAPRLSSDSNPRIASAIKARRIWTTRSVVIAADLTDVDSTFRLLNPQVTWVLFDRLDQTDRAAAIAAAARQYAAEGFEVWLSDGAAARIGMETPPIAMTITSLDSRQSLQQIRYVRYP